MNKAGQPIGSRRFACIVALLALTLGLACAPGASADLSFGGTGSGAGQLTNPQDIVVDLSNGHLYVADQGNNRVDVFDSAGNFLFAFGWGVADGASAELQSCTTTCSKGLEGGGAGEFSEVRQIAVDNDPASPAYHDVYTFDGSRVQRFTATGEFLRAWGGGVVTGGAKGSGDLISGSATITNVKTTQKAFEAGQTITGVGIPANTRIAALGNGTVSLSKAATVSGAGVALNVAEGAGNVPLNEKQLLKMGGPGTSISLTFQTPNPSPSSEATPSLPSFSSPGTIQNALEELSNIDPGDVAVSGGAGGSYTIEFKGRFADTNVKGLAWETSGSGFSKETVQNGASAAELCTPASAADCAAGVARCDPISGFCANPSGSGAGQFEAIGGLATGPGGSVHVTDRRPLGPGEGVFANRVQAFEPSGAFVTQFEALGGKDEGARGLALDSFGNPYISTLRSLRQYDPAGALLATLDPTSDSAGGFVEDLGIDAADNVFVGAGAGTVEYDSAAAIQRVLYGIGGHPTPYHSPGGDLFGLSGNQVLYTSVPAPGPAALKGQATAIGNVKATLNASLNPEGKSTTYHFQYVDQQGFEEAGYASPKTTTTTESASIGSDFKLRAASAAVGLAPETTYHFRAVATNADGVAIGADATFKTLEALEFKGAWLTDVGVEAATIHGAVDPLGIAATGYFQYVDDATYQESGFAEALDVPNVGGGQSPLDYGSGVGSVPRSAVLYPLTPATTYHYRLVAKDSFGTFIDAERTFRTFPSVAGLEEGCPNQALRTGPSAVLPDCRAYEMVSPLDKNNGDIRPAASIAGYLNPFYQSSTDGEGLTYSSYRAFADPQGAPYVNQYLARRGEEAWSTEAISPPRHTPIVDAQLTGTESEFQVFSPDLSSAWLFHDTEPLLAPGAIERFINLYRRNNSTGEYEALSTVEPPHPHHVNEYLLQFEGASADGSHALYTAPDKLTPAARNSTDIYQLYEYYDGGLLRLVSVLPDGSTSKLSSSAGYFTDDKEYRAADLIHAISDDGSRIFWTAHDTNSERLYVRIDGERTVAISDAADGNKAQFWLADPAGTKVVFSTNAGGLYEFDVDAEEEHLIVPSVQGVIGASEDASRIYFVSGEVLTGEEENSAGGKAQTEAGGARNVYLYEAGVGFTYVATLTGGSGEADRDVFDSSPFRRTSRVTPDGLHLAFMSSRSLTGYDTTDAISGEADTEVYRFDAETKQLDCASCNPSGARPLGLEAPRLHNGARYTHSWVSGAIPGWQTALYAQRVLSEEGSRLFFESYDSLVPRDGNGQVDIYEWEAPGAGSCSVESTAFYAANGGCLYLISTGQSPGIVEFVDASPSGKDVFFTTASSIVPQDYGLIDVYDARADGGYAPPSAPPAICEGEACQSPPAPPNDPTPASSAYEGPGNPAPAAKKKAKKKKAKHKKHQRKQARAANHDRRAQR